VVSLLLIIYCHDSVLQRTRYGSLLDKPLVERKVPQGNGRTPVTVHAGSGRWAADAQA
jgi:hypothetical protein